MMFAVVVFSTIPVSYVWKVVVVVAMTFSLHVHMKWGKIQRTIQRFELNSYFT